MAHTTPLAASPKHTMALHLAQGVNKVAGARPGDLGRRVEKESVWRGARRGGVCQTGPAGKAAQSINLQTLPVALAWRDPGLWKRTSPIVQTWFSLWSSSTNTHRSCTKTTVSKQANTQSHNVLWHVPDLFKAQYLLMHTKTHAQK